MIKRCLKKDRRAQNSLYKQCYDVMMTISYRYSRNKEEAVELLNASFLKVLINLKKYKSETPFEYWVKAVVKNEILDQLRKNKRYDETILLKQNDSQLEIIQHNFSIDEHSSDKIEWLKYKSKNLPKTTAKVFNLYAFEGYRHAEIAEMLDMSEGTSQWHYSEAKKKLKNWYAESNVQ